MKKDKETNKAKFGILFGQICRNRRETLGLSLEEAADTMGLGITYYRAVEVGAFNPHSTKSRTFANTMQWETLAVMFTLQILSEVNSARYACKEISEKDEAEKEVRTTWLEMYPEFSFLDYKESSPDELSKFLVIGLHGVSLDRKALKFFKENPKFPEQLAEFAKIFSMK